MGKPSTFIKIDRNITNWQWYQNANTFRVFVDLILDANIKEGSFQGVKIPRGSTATSYEKIANRLNLTVQQVRTAIQHLKSTGELTSKSHSKFQVITIVNYNLYQDKSTGKNSPKQQSVNIQLTVNQQQSKNNKEFIKNAQELCENTCARGKYKNVILSEDELALLVNRYPKDYQEKIERLSKYMADTGRSYASHYDTIIEGAEKDAQKETKAAEGADNGLKSFEADDFFQAAMKKSYRDLNGGSE
jgi:biotin operon repressor